TGGHLGNRTVYANFEVSAEIKLGPQANASLVLRARGIRPMQSYYAVNLRARSDKAQHVVANLEKISYPNQRRKLQSLTPIATEGVRPNTWLSLHVIAIGNRIVVRVNEGVAADYVDNNNPFLAGNLAFDQ